jgi:transcription elongation factor Elf1
MRKEIKQSKVNRMRNLVLGKHKQKTELRSGFSRRVEKRKEGDVWSERGKTWTIKRGIKQTIGKLDSIRKEITTPLCCPKCDKSLRHWLDKHAYKHFQFCNSCLAHHELKIKLSGKWDSYVKNINAKDFEVFLKEAHEEFTDWLKSTESNNFITEQGDIEDWGGGQSKEELVKSFDTNINKLIEKFKETHNG